MSKSLFVINGKEIFIGDTFYMWDGEYVWRRRAVKNLKKNSNYSYFNTIAHLELYLKKNKIARNVSLTHPISLKASVQVISGEGDMFKFHAGKKFELISIASNKPLVYRLKDKATGQQHDVLANCCVEFDDKEKKSISTLPDKVIIKLAALNNKEAVKEFVRRFKKLPNKTK